MAIDIPVFLDGLRKLLRNAIPETLDFVVQSAGADPVTLLSGLLRYVPAEIKAAQVDNPGLELSISVIIVSILLNAMSFRAFRICRISPAGKRFISEAEVERSA